MNARVFSSHVSCWIAATWLALLAGLRAQLPVQSTEAHQIDGETVVEWFGYQGRTYFIQVSDDSDPLRKWIWAPVIEGGNDEAISYEFGGTAPRGFARLQYTDAVPPPGVSLENWDIDGDGLSNLEEISGSEEQEASNPLQADTDGDGTPDGSDPSPNDATSGGLAIRGTWESRWIGLNVADEAHVFGGGALAMSKIPAGDDPSGGEWVVNQEEFGSLYLADDCQDVLDAAPAFPLPEDGEQKLRGLSWENIKVEPYDWDLGGLDLGPYHEWSSGRLEHRLRLNKGAPPKGYEFPLQVLKLNWTRNASEGSPWVAAGGSSIIKKFSFAPGETLSEWASYDPITSLAENHAVTLHAIRFEEVEPESGFDDHVRYDSNLRFQLPWLVVANSTTASTKPNAQVKLHFSPAEPPLNLTVDVPGRTATVSPTSVSGSEPVVLTIEGDLGPIPSEGMLKINGIDVLQLAFYPRKEVKLAVHEISLVNDDEEQHYVKVFGQPAVPVNVGEGKPDTVCIRKGANGNPDTGTTGGDDFLAPAGGFVRTGPNGICETTAAGDDEQVIPVGKGEPNAVIIIAGNNGELNTAPNELKSALQDDEVVGTTITTGNNGIRETPSPNPKQDPVNVPSQVQLKQYLDRTYGKQANLWFDILEWNKKDAAFDVASSQSQDATYPSLQRPNHYFDHFTTQATGSGSSAVPLETREEQLLKSASYATGGEVLNLYFIAAPLKGYSSPNIFNTTIGYGRSQLRRSYVSAFSPNLVSIGQTATFQLLGAAAHELAHNDLLGLKTHEGLRHPWEKPLVESSTDAENGLIPYSPVHYNTHTLVDQPSDTKRLMWRTNSVAVEPTTNRYPSKLLKNEVDWLHKTADAP